MNQTDVMEKEGSPRRGHVDWASILAGAAIAAAASLVFASFTAALGLGSFSADAADHVNGFLLFVAGLFAFLATLAVYFLGGYITGRMRNRTSASEDELEARDGIHGLTVWAVGMILSGFVAAGAISGAARTAGNVATTAIDATGQAVGGVVQGAGQLTGGLVSGAGQAVGGAISGVGQLAGGAIDAAAGADMEGDILGQGNPLDYYLDRFFRSEQQAPDQFSNEQIRTEIANMLTTLLRTGELPEEDLDYMRRALAARTTLTPAQIDSRVERIVTDVQQLRTEAMQRVEQAQQQAQQALDAAQARAEELRTQAEQKLAEAKQQAADAADAARNYAVWTALFAAVTSLLAAIAAWMGAIKGGHDRDAGRIWAGLRRSR